MEKNLYLETEIQGSFLVCQRLIKQVKSLKLKMLCQEAAVKQKDAVSCQVKLLAVENYKLKITNFKFWKLLERQRNIVASVQAEIDSEREETEALIS